MWAVVTILGGAFVVNAAFNHTEVGLLLKSSGRWYVFLFYLPFGVLLPALLMGRLANFNEASIIGTRVSMSELVGVAIAAVAAAALTTFPLAPFVSDAPGWKSTHRLFALLLVASLAEVMLFLGLVGNAIVVGLHRSGFSRTAAKVVAAVSSCVLFGLFHFTYPVPWNNLGTVLLLAVIWGGVSLVFFLTRSILGALIFNNSMALVGFLQRDLQLPGTVVEGWIRALFAILLGAFVVALVKRRFAAQQPPAVRPQPTSGSG
jgi:hypothetical protein